MTRLFEPALSLGVGASGGWIASIVGVPMPWLLGALVANAVWVMSLRRDPVPVAFPRPLLTIFISVIGIVIGGMFTPDLAASVLTWWPGFLAVVLFTVLAQLGAYLIYNRWAGLDPPTSFFAASPGGFVENITMGDDAGGDVMMITLLQFLRVVTVLIAVPFGFMLWSGQAVGSAAGIFASAPDHEVACLMDYIWMAAAAGAGLGLAQILKIPAGRIIGPVLCSAALHLTGVLTVQPHDLVMIAAQIVVGASLGVRFFGLSMRQVLSAFWSCGLAVLFYLLLALGFSFALHHMTGEDISVYVMSFAPAGVIEMTLVAITLDTNPVFVTAHHILRIFTTVLVTPPIYHRIIRRAGAP